jgi:Uma2 family endonuclease
MPAASHPSTVISEQAFLALPETLERVELIDGEVIVSPSPSDRHQRLVVELVFALRGRCADHAPAVVRVAPLDVRLGPGRIVQPDVFVVLSGIPDASAEPLDVVPDLVIEVLSSRRSYDRITKRVLYAEAGVRAYWVVDPFG